MGLLEKFESVEIKAENQISESDKEFCEAHQTAYNDAKTSLLELSVMWEDILEGQKNALKSTGDSSQTYVAAGSITSLSKRKIEQQIDELHPTFIECIVRHFRDVYHVSLEEYAIKKALIPEEPRWRHTPEYDKEMDEYEEKKRNLSLKYRQIVELIFQQTGGRSLWEYALYQLKEKCHGAVWFYDKCRYERKANMVQISSVVYSEYELSEGGKNIIRGLAHFETERIGIIPREFSDFFMYHGPGYGALDFEDCKKVTKIRLYKNGRMDIRFTEEAYAVQFIEGYLGTTK